MIRNFYFIWSSSMKSANKINENRRKMLGSFDSITKKIYEQNEYSYRYRICEQLTQTFYYFFYIQ